MILKIRVFFVFVVFIRQKLVGFYFFMFINPKTMNPRRIAANKSGSKHHQTLIKCSNPLIRFNTNKKLSISSVEVSQRRSPCVERWWWAREASSEWWMALPVRLTDHLNTPLITCCIYWPWIMFPTSTKTRLRPPRIHLYPHRSRSRWSAPGEEQRN